MAFSNYLIQKVLDHYFRNIDLGAPPATIYLSLHRDVPTVTGSEVNGGAYARQAVIFLRTANTLTGPTATITFPTPTTDWGTVMYFAIYDALTVGNMLCYGPITPTLTITSGQAQSVLANALTVTGA